MLTNRGSMVADGMLACDDDDSEERHVEAEQRRREKRTRSRAGAGSRGVRRTRLGLWRTCGIGRIEPGSRCPDPGLAGLSTPEGQSLSRSGAHFRQRGRILFIYGPS